MQRFVRNVYMAIENYDFQSEFFVLLEINCKVINARNLQLLRKKMHCTLAKSKTFI